MLVVEIQNNKVTVKNSLIAVHKIQNLYIMNLGHCMTRYLCKRNSNL